MSSSNFASDEKSQNPEAPHVLTLGEKAVLQEKTATFLSPEEMRQKLQLLLDYSREIVRLGELILDEKRR